MNNTSHLRRIRSFVLREGRLTKGQQHALDSLWPRFGINSETTLDFNKLFGNHSPTVMEIGFGNGESLHQMALENPQYNYLGIEVHRPGVGNLLLQIEDSGIDNVRIICHDAVDILQHCIVDQSLQKLNLFFPDPWHKKKHHKRRIVQHTWLELVADKLLTDGILHIATDWADYADHVNNIMQTSQRFTPITDNNIKQCLQRPTTKFEQRGLRLGHTITDLAFSKVK